MINHWKGRKAIQMIVNLDGEYDYQLLKQEFKTKKES